MPDIVTVGPPPSAVAVRIVFSACRVVDATLLRSCERLASLDNLCASFAGLIHSRISFQAVDWVLGCPIDGQWLTNC